MRTKLRLSALVLCCAMLLPAATITYYTTDLDRTSSDGSRSARVHYLMDDFELGQNYEIALRYDPRYFTELINPLVDSTVFDALVLQPNNPPGAFGTLSLLVKTTTSSRSANASLDVILAGHIVPYNQPFTVSELDANDHIIRTIIEDGRAVGVVPEPSASALVAAGLVLLVAASRRKS